MPDQERTLGRESVHREFIQIFNPHIKGSERWRYFTSTIATLSAPTFAYCFADGVLSHTPLIVFEGMGVLVVGFASAVVSESLARRNKLNS